MEIMGIVKDLYSFPEEQKIGSGALDFDGFFFFCCCCLPCTRDCLDSFHIHYSYSQHSNLAAEKLTLTFYLHIWTPNIIPYENSSTHIRVSVRRNQEEIHTHTHACTDKKKDDLFPYLFI